VHNVPDHRAYLDLFGEARLAELVARRMQREA